MGRSKTAGSVCRVKRVMVSRAYRPKSPYLLAERRLPPAEPNHDNMKSHKMFYAARSTTL